MNYLEKIFYMLMGENVRTRRNTGRTGQFASN